jgi:hypothetical protein
MPDCAGAKVFACSKQQMSSGMRKLLGTHRAKITSAAG